MDTDPAGPAPEGHAPRHRRQGGARRLVRRLVAATVVGGLVFGVAGLSGGENPLAGLLAPWEPDAPSAPGSDPGSDASGSDGAVPGAAAPDAVEGEAGRSGRQPAVQEEPFRTDAPPPGLEEQDEPLARPARPSVPSSSFEFLATNDDGTPVGYSPCRPLHYVINAELAPAGSETLVEDAIATISRATGIVFIDDGATRETPSPSRAAYQKDAYGDRWAPLLIAWSTPEQAPQLKGPVIGTGGSTHYSFDGGPKTFVTGSLELDAPQIGRDLQSANGAAYATAVILHELGHVMGLEHVDDPTQLMYPEIGTPDGLAAGDLNGLYRLSGAKCRKDL